MNDARKNITRIFDGRPSRQDRIPGSLKRRTFVHNASVYSHESDLDKITNKQYRAAGANLKKGR